MAVAIAWLPGPAGTRRRVAKLSVEEPDAAEPARPDLWGARVSNDPGLPDRFGVPVASSAQENDRAALIARDTATGGAHWTTTTNGTRSASLGTWHGVTTDGDGRVTRLSLEDSNLTGAIPPALGTVTTLRNQEDLTDDGS